MTVERITLPNGQWADLTKRPSHGATKRIRRAFGRTADEDLANRTDATVDLETEIVGAMLVAWNVTDAAGVALEPTDEGILGAPGDVIDELYLEACRVYAETKPNPKGTATKSGA